MSDTPATLLVATDFSSTAAAAADWALAIARDCGGRIVLVHALPMYGPVNDFIMSPPDLEEHLRGMAVQRLGERAAELADSGIEVEPKLAIGIPSEAIVRTATEVGASLLVIGTTGMSGLAHLLLGSTAERVVQHAPCPVLSVHAGDAEAVRPIRSILLPTDFSRDALSAAHIAVEVLACSPERLTLLHAFHLPVEYTAYGAIPTGLAFEEDVGGVAEQRLEEVATKLARDGLTVSSVAREGYPPEVIVEVAQEIDADVIAMGTHGRSGLSHLLLGSNAERVVQHASCPVLTVRHPESAR